MPKLSDLLNDERFPKAQRDYVNQRIKTNLPEGKDKILAAQDCLQELWHSYDYDGISMGRSLRSAVLEEILQQLNSHFKEEAKQLLAILVAMYHDANYINKSKWYDYHVTVETLPLGYRILLLSACVALGLDNLPEVVSETDSITLQLMFQGKEKRRLAWKAHVFQ